MESKGIINLEFLAVFFILLLTCSMVVSISIQEFKSIDQTQNRKEARMISQDISKIINTVYIQQDGSEITYTLPSKINQESYIVQINKTGVYVNSHYQLTNEVIIPKMNLNKNNYILTPGNTYVFKHYNDTIIIQQNN